MAGVMVECPLHGVMSAQGFIEGTGTVVVSNSRMTCPVAGCSQMARVLDGHYELRDTIGLPTIFTPTPAEQNRLKNILRWAEEKLADDLVDDSEVAASLERGLRKEAPAVAGWLDKLGGKKSMGIAAWLMLLLMVYQIVTQGQGVSADDLQRAVDEGVRQIQEQQQQVIPAEPTEPPAAPDEGEDSTPQPPESSAPPVS